MLQTLRLAGWVWLVLFGLGVASQANAQATATLWNGYQGSSQVPLNFAPASGTESSGLHYLGVALSTGNLSSSMAISQGIGNSWTVDTGSTGMVITADYLFKAFGINASQLPQNTPGSITYTSSNLTYSGFVYPLNVGLYSSNGSGAGTLGATSQVPILIATSRTDGSGNTIVYCSSGSSCTPTSKSLEQFGVGFGRAQGSSNVNPLLNLTSVSNGNIQTMAPGYVVTNNSVLLGLTPAQLSNTAFASLLPSSSTTPTSLTSAYAIAATKTDWQTPAMTMAIKNAAASANGTYYGSLLVDTGIGNMELSTGGSSFWNPQYNTQNPAQSSSIQVYLPGALSAQGQPLSYLLVYQGNCGGAQDTCPPYAGSFGLSPVYPSNSANASGTGIAFVTPSANTPLVYPFINTGTNFLNYFNIVYDPVSGFIGYQVSPTASQTNNNPVLSQSIALQGSMSIPAGTSISQPTFLFAEFAQGYTGAVGPQTTAVLSSPGQVIMSGVISSELICGSVSCAATGLEIAGGTFVLTANNAYLGGTAVDPGATLVLTGTGSIASSAGVTANGTFDISGTTAGASIATLSGSGTVSLGGQTLTLNNASGSFGGVIADGGLNGGAGGALTIAAGNQTLTGANTYTGATTINAGATLALAGTGSIARSSGVAANGIFDISGTTSGASVTTLSGSGAVNLGSQSLTLTNAAGTFSGSIGGSGGLVVGGGLQALTGSNTYTGGTTISGGATLAIGADSALGASTGGLTFNGGALLALSSFSTGRSITIGSGGGLVNANGFQLSLNGPISINGPFVTMGSVALAGSATVNSSTTSINGNFTAPSLFIASTGTLRGTGTINAQTRVEGRLAPGNSPGTLTFTAPVTLGSTSTTQFDIDGTGTGTGAGNYSRVIVTGAGNSFTAAGTLAPLLRGITGNATNSFTPTIGQGFTVVSAAGGLLGSYASLTQPAGLAAGTRFDALYAPTTLNLVVTPAFYGNLALAGLPETANQAAVGGALDAARPAAGVAMSATQSAIYTPLYVLPGAIIPPTLEQLSPTIYGDAMMVGRNNWYLVGGAISEQLEARRGAQAGDKAQMASGPGGSTIWLTGLGQFGNVSSNGTAGYSSTSGGVATGIDVPLNTALTVGGAFGFTNQNTSAKNAASFTGDAFQFELYGSLRQGIAFVDMQAGGLFSEGTATRPLFAYGVQANGNTGGSAAGGSLRAGVRLDMAEWHIEPSLTLAGVNLNQGSLTETQAGPIGLSVSSASVGSLQTLLGVRVERRVPVTESVTLVPSAQIGWLHEYLDTQGATRASFIGAPGVAFGVQSASIGRDAAAIGLRAALDMNGPISVYASYAGTLNGNSSAQTVSAGLRFVW